jgi:hypothetical protein
MLVLAKAIPMPRHGHPDANVLQRWEFVKKLCDVSSQEGCALRGLWRGIILKIKRSQAATSSILLSLAHMLPAIVNE